MQIVSIIKPDYFTKLLLLKNKVAFFVIFPAIIYFSVFCILTYPLILKFNSHFFTDDGDGLQNVWNIWWVNKAIKEINQNPWHTTYLHYPQGTSLVGQTLNIFNGIIGIPLLMFFDLTKTFNIILLFSFVSGGVSMFWLSFYLTKKYLSSLVAGCIFTFSQYHFSHAEGHLQLVSLEFIPLFCLLWIILMEKPGVLISVSAALVHFLVLLCDYYYFLYCVFFGALYLFWFFCSRKNKLPIICRAYFFSFFIFFIFSLFSSGVLVYSLIRLNHEDPLIGAHDPASFSLDLLAPFIPGGHWKFASVTKKYWSRLPGNIHESSVYIGLSVFFVFIYALYKRKSILPICKTFDFWYLNCIFFGLMALGPLLRIGGKVMYTWIMPYDFLQLIIPPLKLSGCPVRMMVMVTLGTSVIAAIGLPLFFYNLQSNRSRFFLAFFCCTIFFIDFLPKELPSTNTPVPEYIKVLKDIPGSGGFLDTVNDEFAVLFYQTIHQKPLGNGYISRYPSSVFLFLKQKNNAVKSKDLHLLLTFFDIRYMLVSSDYLSCLDDTRQIEIIYKSNDIFLVKIIDIRVPFYARFPEFH